jgi:hexosaminidase
MGYYFATHMFQAQGNVELDSLNRCAVVTLQAQGGAPVRYTLDGSAPSESSKVYRKPLVLNGSVTLRAATFRDGMEPREFACSFDSHKALGNEMEYSSAPHRWYRSGLPACLTDGLRGTESFKTPAWAAWRGNPVEFVVKMNGGETVGSVSVGMLRDQKSNIFLPESITVAVSSDGVGYTEVVSRKYESESESPDCLTDLTLTFDQVPAEYVKVTVVPLAKIPQWRSDSGNAAYIFIDEIMIN